MREKNDRRWEGSSEDFDSAEPVHGATAGGRTGSRRHAAGKPGSLVRPEDRREPGGQDGFGDEDSNPAVAQRGTSFDYGGSPGNGRRRAAGSGSFGPGEAMPAGADGQYVETSGNWTPGRPGCSTTSFTVHTFAFHARSGAVLVLAILADRGTAGELTRSGARNPHQRARTALTGVTNRAPGPMSARTASARPASSPRNACRWRCSRP